MKPTSSTALSCETNDPVLSLVDRLDPAIGEASSMMGAVMQEMLLRSLRGGVMKLSDELDSYVAEHVDATLAERKPLIEQTASAIADKTAREVATEVAGQEVQAVESWAREATQELAGQMVEAERRAQQTTTEATHRLAQEIVAAEKRATETARTEIEQQVQDLLQRSRKGASQWETRFKALEESVELWRKEHCDVMNVRKTELAVLRGDLQRQEREAAERQAVLEQQRQEQARLLEECQSLRAEVHELQQSRQDLAARVADLEKPRGFRAKLSGWFSKNKEEPPPE